jgi:hypothetical protein
MRHTATVEQFLIAAVLVVLAGAIAFFLRRRRPQPPTQPRWSVPTQLDRADFTAAERPWLVVVFTSATCDSCAQATSKASLLESPEVAYEEVPWQDRKDLHTRYAVDVVPMTLVADEEGVVRASFIGAPNAADLWAAVADARSDGVDGAGGV